MQDLDMIGTEDPDGEHLLNYQRGARVGGIIGAVLVGTTVAIVRPRSHVTGGLLGALAGWIAGSVAGGFAGVSRSL